MERAQIRCIVSGKVHGVSYRNFVQKHARHLALVGYVRNAPNFKVELVAEGFEDDLKRLLELARKGPFMAHVSDLEVHWAQASGAFKTFDIEF